MATNNTNEEVAQKIVDYVEEYEIKQLLQEYMKRVIMERPKDPLKFLTRSITENPYRIAKLSPNEESKAAGTAAEEKALDGKDVEGNLAKMVSS